MISVVLPTYNGERFIEESINSIISQTISDWELIIVDDCSGDNTPEIVDNYANLDSRIQVVHNKENRKLPASLNIGFRNARGEYLTWTSDDNIYAEDAFEIMKEYLETHPQCPMICTAMDYIDTDGKKCGKSPRYDRLWNYYDNSIGACFMYRASVKDKIGDYNETLFGVEDYEYWLRIIKNYGDIHYLDESHYYYRRHGGSLTETMWLQIKKRLNQLRTTNFDAIYANISDSPELLSGLYFDMIISDSLTSEQENTLLKHMPYLTRFIDEDIAMKNLIIYGAGDYGDKAFSLVGRKAVAYADRNTQIVGKKKNGIPIISKEMLFQREDDFVVVIAIDSIYSYSVASELFDSGIRNITSLQHLLRNRAKVI